MKFHNILKKKHANWVSIENEIAQLDGSRKEKGDIFEEFVYAYLTINQRYYQIRDIYRSKDIPSKYLKKYKLSQPEVGVDGLFILTNGKAAAYQAKFNTNRKKPTYEKLAKFWTEAEHTDYWYVIANCSSLTKITSKKPKHLQILVDSFDELDDKFFESLFLLANRKKPKKTFFTPYPFQKKIVKDAIVGFKTNNRGKVIAACGTGKTLMSLWINEKMHSKNTLIVVPSLWLVKQTLEMWSDQAIKDFRYLCVCSDPTVSQEIDDGDIEIGEIPVPVTNNPEEIAKFIKGKETVPKYIFSTYNSLVKIENSFSKSGSKFSFDLIIFDEAHRTAGGIEKNFFTLGLENSKIKSDKRLFMTATERLLKPALKQRLAKEKRTVFSMDDETIYGKVFHRFNFGDAIRENVIADYQIIIAGIEESQLYDWIRNNKRIESFDSNKNEYETHADTLFKQIVLSKVFNERPINKVFTFHSCLSNAKLFSGERGQTKLSEIIIQSNKNISEPDLYVSHINGQMNTANRKVKLDDFKSSKYGVISNVRCLGEGVNVPLVDAIYFVDPKESIIDIVQACGRALRKPRNIPVKTAYFILPTLVPDGVDNQEILNLEEFDAVYNVIQALRDQDNQLAEWIDELNENVAKGKRAGKFKQPKKKNIHLILPKRIDLKDFEEKLYLKIATVNSEPLSSKYKPARTYGKGERKSGYKRIFRTIGDYSYDSYFKKLVDPTINIYKKNKKTSLHKSKIKINHNNVSHTKRLGLIEKKDENFLLTPLGNQYLKTQISPKKLFRKQMLRYHEIHEERRLFPYRAFLKILIEVKTLNWFEFVFAIYTLYDSSPENIALAVEDVKYIRQNYPNMQISNQQNKKKFLKELNEYFGSNYNKDDIWTSKTTVANQYIYFKNHLSLFDEYIIIYKKGKKIILREKSIAKLNKLLAEDSKIEYEKGQSDLLKNYGSPILTFIIFNL